MPLRPRPSDQPWWASALATVVTFAMLSLTFARGGVRAPEPSAPDSPSRERLLFVIPPAPAALPVADEGEKPRSSGGRPASTRAPSPIVDGEAQSSLASGRGNAGAPRDTGAAFPAAVRAAPRASLDAASQPPALPGPRSAASITGRGAFPPRAVRDSINAALGASIPALARTRAVTQEERDERWRQLAAAHREARNTGRPAPVGDPGKAGAQMGGAAVSVPIFSPGPSRAQRMRDSLTWKRGEPVRRRLQARLDSMQRIAARRDSILAAARREEAGEKPGN